MKRALLLAFTLFTSVQAWSSDKDGYYVAHSPPPCGKYIEARQNGADLWAKWWITGYLTAYNERTPDTVDIAGDTDRTGIYLWLENWCKENPLKTVGNGMDALMVELYPNRHKTTKATGR